MDEELDYLQIALEELNEQITHPQDDYSTGVDELNIAMGRLASRNTLCIVAGPSSAGKSWLTMNMIMENARNGVKCGYYDGENTPLVVIERFAALYCKTSYNAMLRDKRIALDSISEFSESEAYNNIKFGNGITKPFTLKAIQEFIVQNKLELLVIDNFALIQDGWGEGYQNYYNVVSVLRKLQYDTKCTIVIVSQVRRDKPVIKHLYTKDDVALTKGLADFATVVIMLDSEYINVNGTMRTRYYINVDKNRDGHKATITVDLLHSSEEFVNGREWRPEETSNAKTFKKNSN